MPKEAQKVLVKTLNSIFGGQQAVWSFGNDDEFLFSLGIDPELVTASVAKPSGTIFPTRYSRFSGENLLGAPMWIANGQTSAGLWVYDSNGSVVTYGNAYNDEVGHAAIPHGTGNGMAVYNDYVYCASASTIHRSGRISQTAPEFAEYWVTSLAMSSLSQPVYPATRSVDYPNHVLYPHNDGYLYVMDFDGANGRLHALITDSDGADGTGEFNVLTLPPNMMPMAAAPYGTDIAIVASPIAKYAVGAIPVGQNAKMYLWDTVRGHKFYRVIDIGEPLATAIVNKNGELFVTAGNIDTGYKLLRYLGGESFDQVASIYESSPPPAGAIDVRGDMVACGAFVSYPVTDAGVIAYGYRDGRLGKAIQHIARSTAVTGTLPIVSCLKFLQRNQTPVIGWRTQSNYGLDRFAASGTHRAVLMTKVERIGRPFRITRITVPMADAVQAGTYIEVDVICDDENKTYGEGEGGLKDITAANYSGEYLIDQRELTIEGKNNYYIKFQFTGTAEDVMQMPITVEIEFLDR